MAFVIGVLAGIVASVLVSFLAKLFPARWVRYSVRFGAFKERKDLAATTRVIPVVIKAPLWRILKEPLREYLIVEVRGDNGAWVQSKWDEGDVGVDRLRVDAAMTAYAIAFTVSSNGGKKYLGDKGFEGEYEIQGQSRQIGLRIVRSVDEKIAIETVISV
jgi:hypothetical protein